MTLARREDLYFTLVLGLVLAVRPLPALREPLARALGGLAFRVSSGKRRRTLAAIADALGEELDPAARRRAARGAFIGFWLELLEWRPAPGTLSVEGIDRLAAAVARGRGAVLWVSRGFGLRGVAGELLHRRGFALVQVHGPRHLGGFLTREADASWLRRRVVRPFFDRRERRWSVDVVDLPADSSLAFARALAERLEENRVLCVAGDGPEGRRHVTLPFLGTRERFATGMASLARATGAPILPLMCYRDGSGGCRIEIGPEIEVAEGDREDARAGALARYAELLEGYVRRHPDQYRIWHILPPA